MPKISFAKNQIWLLKQTTFDPETQEELQVGTEVKIIFIDKKDGLVELQFPNGKIWKHFISDIPHLFTKKETTYLNKVIEGVGTPPKELHKFLPDNSDWKKSYIWRVIIELEEIGNKRIICPSCSSEITNLENINDTGDLFCKRCNEYVAAFNLETNELYNTLS